MKKRTRPLIILAVLFLLSLIVFIASGKEVNSRKISYEEVPVTVLRAEKERVHGGRDEEYIVADYMKSKENLQPMLDDFARRNPEIDVRVITPQEKYIREFLEWKKGTYL